MSDARWRGLALVCPTCCGGITESRGGAQCLKCGAEFSSEDGILDMRLGRQGSAGYDPHFYGVLQESEKRHFWFTSRREVVLAALRRAVPDLNERRMFDIGCGTGALLEFLSRSGVTVSGACDAYQESLQLVRQRLTVPLILVDEGRPVPLGEGFGLVGMFDVLEHIDDDLGTLKRIRRALEPGGFLVLTVPAHPALFSSMDLAACHRRRYSRGELRRRLEEAGFEIRFLSHFMMVLAPLLLAVLWGGRVWRRRKTTTAESGGEFRVVPILNDLLRFALGVERALMSFVSLPFGSSLVAVASRAKGTD